MDENQPTQSPQAPASEIQSPTPLSNTPDNKKSFIYKYKNSKILLFGLGGFVVLILLVTALILSSNRTPQEKQQPIQNSNPEKELNKAKEEKNEATLSAEEAAKPLNRLQKTYDDVIGSNSLKKTLTLDESGTATIDYVIASGDGTVILKTSYENFADLAVKVFNIETVKRLNVSSYATKFTDKFGQPNQVALKLEIDRETNDKINWPVKKYVYKDYSTILNFHQVNPNLDKDYKTLVRSR